MKRKGMGKRLRFEILKRDGYRCRYCGANPTEIPLHVDHVIPVAKGGTDDPANLVTACRDCNGGKSAIPLEERKLKSVTDPEDLRDQVEQIREYLEAQRAVTDARNEVSEELLDRWQELVGYEPRGLRARLPKMVAEFGVAKLVEAFEIVGRNGISGGDKQIKYLYGILRRWRGDGTKTAPPQRHVVLDAAKKAVHEEIAKISREQETREITLEDKKCRAAHAFVESLGGSEADVVFALDVLADYDDAVHFRGVTLRFETTGTTTTFITELDLDFDIWRIAYDELSNLYGRFAYLSPPIPDDLPAQITRAYDRASQLFHWAYCADADQKKGGK